MKKQIAIKVFVVFWLLLGGIILLLQVLIQNKKTTSFQPRADSANCEKSTYRDLCVLDSACEWVVELSNCHGTSGGGACPGCDNQGNCPTSCGECFLHNNGSTCESEPTNCSWTQGKKQQGHCRGKMVPTVTPTAIPNATATVIPTQPPGDVCRPNFYNGSFEQKTKKLLPLVWQPLGLSPSDKLVNDALDGNFSFGFFTTNNDVVRQISQYIVREGAANERIDFSFSYKQLAKENRGMSGAVLRVYYINGSEETVSWQAEKNKHDWQTKTLSVTPNAPYLGYKVYFFAQNNSARTQYDQVNVALAGALTPSSQSQKVTGNELSPELLNKIE